MIALRAHDDADAEMLRLRHDLLAFVVDEITRTAPPGRSHALAGPVADAITETAAAATRAELFQLGRSQADAIYGALEPQLEQRLPALVQQAVTAALAEAAPASQPIPAGLLWAILASNVAAVVAGMAALFLR